MHRRCEKQRVVTAQMLDMRPFWQVEIARDAVLFHSFAFPQNRKGSLDERGGAKDPLPKMSQKNTPRCSERAIWKPKSLKYESFGAPIEVETCKLCTALWRESDSETKAFKTPGSRSAV